MTLQNLSKHFVTGMTLALGAAVFSAGDLQAQEHAGHEEHTGHDNMHETMHSMEYLGGSPIRHSPKRFGSATYSTCQGSWERFPARA